MRRLADLPGNDQAASAAEFALVLPLLLVFLLGIIDTGRFMWDYNRAEKATQMGVRYAVVTDLVPSGLETYSFTVSDSIPAGDPIPTTSFDQATCDSTSCTCAPNAAVCGAHDPVAFTNIVDRMRLFYPWITNSNVTIQYRNIGLGYSGDPNGPDVAPLVTIQLTGLTFKPITTMAFGGTMAMPGFRSALTLEDGAGSVAN